jgi:branched-chain amino acid transport system ATP-binding protein
MRFIFNLCDRVAVLVQGEKLVEGTSDVVQADERVVAAYLGEPFDGTPDETAPTAETTEAESTTSTKGEAQ